MNSIKGYLTTDYLFSPVSGSKLELFYLIVPAVLLLGAIGYRIYLMIRGNRSEAYRSFDRMWFWGSIIFGLFGLFLYFSRTQALPTFSTRTVSYLWLLSLLGYGTYLIFYFRSTVPDKLHDFYSKKRKSKYLGKK
jgi:hypothetical protein